MSTNLCCWASVEGPSWPQRPTEWIWLEIALERYLYCWQEERYIIDGRSDLQQCGFAMPFSKAQLQKTLAEWEALLRAIEARIPGTQITNEDEASEKQQDLGNVLVFEAPLFLLEGEDLEVLELLRDLNLMPPLETNQHDLVYNSNMTPCFLLQFLRRARRPTNPTMQIAPSITIFNARQAHRDMFADRKRRKAAIDLRGVTNKRFKIPSLLFPYVGQDDARISDWVEWQQIGFEDLLVDRRARLYCVPEVRAGWFDGVKFISTRQLLVARGDVDVEINHGLVEQSHDSQEHEASEDNATYLTLEMRGLEGIEASRQDEAEEAEASDSSSAGTGSDPSDQIRHGNDVLFCHDNFYHCPYFRRHNPRLMDVSRAWRSLVESEIVSIGPDGVEGTMEEVWEEAKNMRTGLDEFDIGRCWGC